MDKKKKKIKFYSDKPEKYRFPFIKTLKPTIR